MKVVHIGLGGFGVGWCRAIQQRQDITLAAIVDTNPETFAKVHEFNIPCFTSLEEALASTRPDFIFNATPPGIHLEINRIACAHNIPVLMEKPIAEDFAHVVEMLEFTKKGHKIAVAENYRFYANNIFVKQELDKHLVNISSVNMQFMRRHRMPDHNYHSQMKHPALIDIGVHHIDLLRFFTGKEVLDVYAQASTPSYSWYKGLSGAKILAQMEDGIQFSYDCVMDARAITGWNGHWTFIAENGVARYIDDKLHFTTEGGDFTLAVPENEKGGDKNLLLDEFIAYLQHNKTPQTVLADQIKNAAVVEAAIQSLETRAAVATEWR